MARTDGALPIVFLNWFDIATFLFDPELIYEDMCMIIYFLNIEIGLFTASQHNDIIIVSYKKSYFSFPLNHLHFYLQDISRSTMGLSCKIWQQCCVLQ